MIRILKLPRPRPIIEKFLRLSMKKRNYIFLSIFIILSNLKDLICYLHVLQTSNIRCLYLLINSHFCSSRQLSGLRARGSELLPGRSSFVVMFVVNVTGKIYTRINDRHNTASHVPMTRGLSEFNRSLFLPLFNCIPIYSLIVLAYFPTLSA